MRQPVSKAVRFSVFERDNFTCHYCGAKGQNVELELDHVKPVSEGGSNSIRNLVTACRACNIGKSARRVERKEDVLPIHGYPQRSEEPTRLWSLMDLTPAQKQKAYELVCQAFKQDLSYPWSEWEPKRSIVMIHVTRYPMPVVLRAARDTNDWLRSWASLENRHEWHLYFRDSCRMYWAEYLAFGEERGLY